jgi:hypothetical protein
MLKRQLVSIAIALAGTSFAGASLAQDQAENRLERQKAERGELRDNRARHGHNAIRHSLRRMDTNEDDLISREEYVAAGIARYPHALTRADKNDDGYVTLEEFNPSRRRDKGASERDALQACLTASGSGSALKENRFAAADINADETLSQDEFFMMLEQRTLNQFSRLDSDSNEQLTRDEIKISAQNRQQERDAIRSCMKTQRTRSQ